MKLCSTRRIRQGIKFVLGLSIILSPSVSRASRVSPMIVDMAPTGRSSVGRVELTNDADRKIAYEVQMMRGDISPTGELELTPADEQFLVFPPQSMIEANSKQVFRIQYVGEEALETSQIYYLSVRQVPVEFDEGQTQVQVVVNYNVLVNVVPEGTKALPVVKGAQYVERTKQAPPSTNEPVPNQVEQEKGILVDVSNDGTRYFFAGRADWTIKAETVTGETFELNFKDREAAKYTGVGVIAPGKSRQFFIPTPNPIRSESISISLKL